MGDPHANQRRRLGEFIRAQRSRLKPADVGFGAGARRRTPGLRREEVAQLCGVSATWYTWIEQGRDVSVSPAALGRIATALHLTRAERRYLFDLAGKQDLADDSSDSAMDAPAALMRMLSFIALPAYVLDRTWQARAWNEHAERLFVGWLDDSHGDRNLLRYIFLHPAARALIHDWDARAQRVVAEFRADNSRHMDDPRIRALVDALLQQSPDFKRLWEEQSVLGREGGERTFDHPACGFLRYEQMTFALTNRPDFRLVVLTEIADKEELGLASAGFRNGT